MRSALTYLFFFAAAALEVAGDAVIRKGMRGSGLVMIAAGILILGTYGVVVNLVPWDFSRMIGFYVAVFAAVGVLIGRFIFGDAVPASTWIGLAVIIAGGLVIQLGPLLAR